MTDYAVRNGSMSLPIAWESDGSGDYSYELPDYRGYEIKSVQTIPGLNGDRTTTCPSVDYDVVINDEYAEDIMGAALADCSASVAKTTLLTTPIPVPGVLTIVISNAGVSKTGLILIMLQQADR